MPCELDQLLCEAWTRLGPSILADEDELKARLARRRSPYFQRIPRSLCIAIRAGDRRITPATAAIWPMPALEPTHEAEHHVRLETRLIRDLCRPVRIAWPGEPASEVRKYLGCSASQLREMVKDCRLRVRHIPAMRGRGGRPIPIVYSPDLLDPCAQIRTGPARLTQPLSLELPGRIPDDFHQDLLRIPAFGRPCGRREGFIGWRWICPSCSRRARVVYLPLAAPDWAAMHQIRFPADELDAIPQPPLCFACKTCSGVHPFSTTPLTSLKSSWHHLIMHCSGGLFFGREVKWPTWFKPETSKERRTREYQEETAQHLADRQKRIAESEAWDRQRQTQNAQHP